MKSNEKYFKLDDISDDLLEWTGTLYPFSEPFANGRFCIKIKFPENYPIVPPIITFSTPIYHPNIDDKGRTCLPVILPGQWNSQRSMPDIIEVLLTQLHEPDKSDYLRPKIGQELESNYESYAQKAKQSAANSVNN